MDCKNTMAINDLPNEILDEILDRLNQNEVLALACVSKQWCTIIQKRMYRNICIKSLWMLQGLVDTLIGNTSIRSLISTLDIKCSFRDFTFGFISYDDKGYNNTIYDDLVLLIQRTPSITSVKISMEFQFILFDAIRNTCGTGHWEHMRSIEMKCSYSNYRTIFKGIADLKNCIEKINAASSTDESLVFANPTRRLEVDELDSTVRQFPDSNILVLSLYRLTDWNGALNDKHSYTNITALLIHTSWPTGELLECICKKFTHIIYLKLKQSNNFSTTNNFIIAESVKEFANYLKGVKHFDISLKRLVSQINVEMCFEDTLSEYNTKIWNSKSGLTLYLKRSETL
ncbi:hypothetical protein EDC96DRAFT_540253 [Choanephora cucurbitarum]|nr:hypothetical protein EDC96DRAFT_540253 [Choanephora cucurbitarum]